MNFKESLSRILINQKICSQRCAKNFIKKNEILVNGEKIDDSGFLIDSENDEIFVNGVKLQKIHHIYLMMNKPCGVVCSTKSDSHKTVFDLLREKLPKLDLTNLKCVGRLDSDTSGLLLFSTNGTFVKEMTAPEKKVEKTYFVRLKNFVSAKEKDEYSKKIENGFLLNPEKKSPAFFCKSAKISWISDKTLEITVTEGKFHEVRRIFSTLGNSVVELKRIKIGDFVLDKNLHEGEIKPLTLN